ncbi:MAG: hypothetical protein M3Y79_13320 [Pseudomonadota bacterium]|nr:hypothetical protein [Pseudomonadota bacterium]
MRQWASIGLASLIGGMALAQEPGNRAIPGDILVEPPTLNALGVEWRITGDVNRNASVALEYRKQGDADWRRGAPLLRLNGEQVQQGASYHYTAPNMFAGSVFDLAPATTYELRLTLSDPDINNAPPTQRTTTATTRPVPRPAEGGAVYHVYPRGYTGERQQPAFNSLMAAYNTGSNGADFVNSFQPRVKPGDTILVHAGTYKENRRAYAGANSTLFDGAFYLTADGTADKPIVIKGAGDGEVIFDGDGAAVLFDLTAADYTYIEGITVRNTDTAFLLGRKRILGAVGFTLKNSKIEDVGRGVFSEWGSAADYYIADNVFIGRNDQSQLMGWIGATWRDRPGFPVPLVSEYAVKIYGSGHVVANNRVEFFHDGIDLASYGDPDGWPDKPLMPNSIDIVGNDIRSVDDNCIEADGAAQNVRVIGNRCFNMAHRALSAQPALGGPIYFIRNIVYNAPEGGAVKFTANGAGVLVYNNTFLSEAHPMGPFSNLHYRNNLIMGQGAQGSGTPAAGTGPVLFGVETFTPWSSSDYNGFAPFGNSPMLFAWGQPAGGVAAYTGTRQMVQYPTLAAYSKTTGQDAHSVMLDWSIFTKASPPDRANPTRLHDPADFDFSLVARAAAIDKGQVIPGITDGFTGRAPDLGALERGKAAPHYGPRPVADQP